MARKKVFDSITNQVASQCDTTSARLRNKLKHPYDWCFCDLCYETTEYSISVESQGVCKRLPKGNAKAVSLTDEIRDEAKHLSDMLVERYQRALEGQFGLYEEGVMLDSYCNMIDMRGDHSVASFRDQVERYAINFAWARHGDMLGTLWLPGQPEGAPKPSKLYCMNHNPRRSVQARRNYQRDRRFAAEYQELTAMLRNEHAGRLPSWDIAVYARIRREAYKLLLATKKNIRLIDKYLSDGITNYAEIAHRLGISRQAVSIAIKRHSKDDIQLRKDLCEELVALSNKIFISSP